MTTNKEIIVPHDTEGVRELLNTLNKDYHVSWERIGAFLGVPAGTLWNIANGGKIPRKWKRRLGVRYNVDLWDMPVRELRWAIENRERVL